MEAMNFKVIVVISRAYWQKKWIREEVWQGEKNEEKVRNIQKRFQN